MSMIDLTEFTLNTGTDTDIDVITIARTAYRELPNVATWTPLPNGLAALTSYNRERLTIDLVTIEGRVIDWSTTREDEDGDEYAQDGARVRTITDLEALVEEIEDWANQNA